ncbi:hypothetical protein A2U01_0081238, partial [Trifolium medium]|nr:hypothetical protein [Trifolium medium]
MVGDFNAVCRMEERFGVNNGSEVAISTEVVEFR